MAILVFLALMIPVKYCRSEPCLNGMMCATVCEDAYMPFIQWLITYIPGLFF